MASNSCSSAIGELDLACRRRGAAGSGCESTARASPGVQREPDAELRRQASGGRGGARCRRRCRRGRGRRCAAARSPRRPAGSRASLPAEGAARRHAQRGPERLSRSARVHARDPVQPAVWLTVGDRVEHRATDEAADVLGVRLDQVGAVGGQHAVDRHLERQPELRGSIGLDRAAVDARGAGRIAAATDTSTARLERGGSSASSRRLETARRRLEHRRRRGRVSGPQRSASGPTAEEVPL